MLRPESAGGQEYRAIRFETSAIRFDSLALAFDSNDGENFVALAATHSERYRR
ncbi:MAG: hypothetical protein ACI8W7_003234, partial [Gammaproteobacteria bacterium]